MTPSRRLDCFSSCSGRASTSFSLRSIWRDLTSAFSMVFTVWLILFLTPDRDSPNLPNSVLTAPNVRQTSLDFFSTFRVRKPICRALKKATMVVGPRTTTW